MNQKNIVIFTFVIIFILIVYYMGNIRDSFSGLMKCIMLRTYLLKVQLDPLDQEDLLDQEDQEDLDREDLQDLEDLDLMVGMVKIGIHLN